MSPQRLTTSDRLVLAAICASDGRTLYGAKKLQKLLFIAHHPKAFDLKPKRPLRAFRFKVYKNGPFSEEIYQSLGRLEARGLVEVESRDLRRLADSPVSPDSADEDAPRFQLRIHRALENAEEEIEGADETDLRLVRSAVVKWGWLTSDQIEELVLIRTGLTLPLKAKYAGVEWSKFCDLAAGELPEERRTPPEAFWRSQQQFFKEREGLLRKLGPGKFAAYLGKDRVGIGPDEIALFEAVLAKHGRSPDYIGYISESGRIQVQALGA